MRKDHARAWLLGAVLVAGGLAAWPRPGYGFAIYLDQVVHQVNHRYSCELCHRGGSLNPYGEDFKTLFALHEKDPLRAMKEANSLDSDKDGWTNEEELTAGTWPGNKASVPQGKPKPPAR